MTLWKPVILALGIKDKMIKMRSNITGLFKRMVRKIIVVEDNLKHDAHTFPITVGTEIFRMRKRIEIMPEDTPGLNALNNALNRLEDELNQQGYMIGDLTGQTYVDELTVKVLNSVTREDIKPGEPIISRMIKPQIFYNGEAVYHGEVELAISPEEK